MPTAITVDFEPVGHQSSFFQTAWVQNALPVVTSLSVHLMILLVGMLTYQTVVRLGPIAQTVVPGILIGDDGLNDMVPNIGNPLDARPSSGDFQKGDPLSNLYADSRLQVDPTQTARMNQVLSDVKGPGEDAGFSGLIGVGPGDRTGPSGLGGPGGDQVGNTVPRTPFGVPDGTGSVMFPVPHGQGARSITFVCDASGSMMNKMGALKIELRRAIDSLRPTQAFNVVFFQEGKPAVLSSALLMARPDAKRKAYDFIENVTTAGSTDPVPGLESAFQSKPQLIYLLTDGDFTDNQAVLERVQHLNQAKLTRVHTIAFTSPADSDQAFIEILKTIALENGGSFRHVREDDLK